MILIGLCETLPKYITWVPSKARVILIVERLGKKYFKTNVATLGIPVLIIHFVIKAVSCRKYYESVPALVIFIQLKVQFEAELAFNFVFVRDILRFSYTGCSGQLQVPAIFSNNKNSSYCPSRTKTKAISFTYKGFLETIRFQSLYKFVLIL